MVKTRKMTASFLLALLLLISLNMVVSAEEQTEITVHPGETISGNELGFENIGVTTMRVYAVASGTAADWVSPTTIHFGTVYGGQTVWKTYTIKVPEDVIVGEDYTLIWRFYSEEGYEDTVYHTIHVTSRLLIPWLWIWIIIILVLAIAIPGIVIGVVVSRKKKPPSPPPEAIPPETTESGEV